MSEPTIFEQLTSDPAGHFRLHLHAAVLRILESLGRMHARKALEEHAFLGGYAAEIERAFGSRIDSAALERGILTWEVTGPAVLPLRSLTKTGMAMDDRLLVLAAGLVEEDNRFSRLFASLSGSEHLRPSATTLTRLILPHAHDPWMHLEQALRLGVLDVENRNIPRADWRLFVPEITWNVVRGNLEGCAGLGRFRARHDLESLDELVMERELRARLVQARELISSGRIAAIVLRASLGSDAKRICGAMAREVGLGALELDAWPEPKTAHLVSAAATLLQSVPIVSADLLPGETRALPDLPAFGGPLFVVAGREGGFAGARAERALTIRIPRLDLEARRAAWSQCLPPGAQPVAAAAASRFHVDAGHIRQAASLALLHSSQRAEPLSIEDVRDAMRLLNRQQLDGLADHLSGRPGWDQLILPHGTMARLFELDRRCRHREELLARLGPAFASNGNRGVRALLAGPSGTGKTLAARVIAASLQMDLYRVDLSAVVNKYIGETEKNLHRVLSVAEDLDVVLLLDEGDSLLGGRTEVRSANDRYANLETNFLLQRLESYDGILLVTTNLSDNIDKAFRRRMDVVVDFVTPGPEERLQIWSVHLPRDHRIGPDLLGEVATRFAFSGGQIRNATQHAALLALDEGDATVEWRHLESALRSEQEKAGATWPLPRRAGRIGEDVEAFFEALSR